MRVAAYQDFPVLRKPDLEFGYRAAQLLENSLHALSAVVVKTGRIGRDIRVFPDFLLARSGCDAGNVVGGIRRDIEAAYRGFSGFQKMRHNFVVAECFDRLHSLPEHKHQNVYARLNPGQPGRIDSRFLNGLPER
jgi:hypothetical protein